MADPNLFAVLTACDKSNLASDAFELSENAHCYRKAAEGIAKELMIDSRESTPAPRPLPVVNHEAGYCVLLRLDDPLKDPQIGWQFGTNPRISDVLLGHRGTFGISSRQFYITITDQFRVELHDESRYGTIISHDSQAKDVALKDDKRLLSFQPGAHEQFKEIIVYVPDHEGLAFRIEFPNHREGGLNTGGTYGRQPRTPRRLPVFYDGGEIGRGEFGLGRKLIDLREGQFYAVKWFKPHALTRPSVNKRKRNEVGWLEGIRNEVDNMKNHPHPNIMQVIDFKEKPEPSLWMPYYPHGNLEDCIDVKPWQYVSAFRQMLFGLRHLHGHGVVHRDLKSANPLIAEINPFTIVISDFGFSKFVTSDDLMKTFCGSKSYTAPEIVPIGNRRQGYRSSVDIWSAGIILIELLFGRANHADVDQLPLQKWILAWSDKVIELVYELDENEDQVIDVVKHMVTKRLEDRFSADQCLQRGCENGLFKRRSNGEIVDSNDPSCHTVTEVDTEAETEIATSGADNLDDVGSIDGIPDDGVATPTQPHQRAGKGTSYIPTSILAGELWGSEKSGRRGSAHSSSQMTFIGEPNSGPPTRRQKTSNTASWSLTIGPGHSNTDGGFDLADGEHDWDNGPATGIYIKKDHFIVSLELQFAIKDACSFSNESYSEDEASSVGKDFLVVFEPQLEISRPQVTDSIVAYILQTQT